MQSTNAASQPSQEFEKVLVDSSTQVASFEHERSLTERFRDLDTTGRLGAATTDLQVFSENPILGVGVGRSIEFHDTIEGISLAAHTEYTRLLAEHGLFGLLAIIIIRNYTHLIQGQAQARRRSGICLARLGLLH